ncbi:MAG: histidine kinase [Burkholderiales bacterium]|nr:histidine kinase [Burkholderiales bacterium]
MPSRPSLLARCKARYFAWAQPHYAKLPPHAALEARRIDEFLLSRRAWGFWLGLIGIGFVANLGLILAGFPNLLALLVTFIVMMGLLVGGFSAWLQPEKMFGPVWRSVAATALLGVAGAMVGFLGARLARHGLAGLDHPAELLLDAARRSAPVLAVAISGMLLLMFGVAWARRTAMQREVLSLRLAHERDASARQAAEARLQLLRAQIEPHFVFNTLSAVQHWVDSGDARGAALLRELTAFLRASTDMLGRDRVPLADEAAMVERYLAIQRARLGERLRTEVAIDADVAQAELPPGLLLTLVENAVEHGIAPALRGDSITLRARRADGALRIEVADDGVGLPGGANREGVGLTNSRERLAGRHGDAARLDLLPRAGGGTIARITINEKGTA